MRLQKKHLQIAAVLLSAAFLAAGILMGHAQMIMGYAIVVCLSCIGIG